jgi:hypothetical protein
MPASFDSGNVALASFPFNNINKGRWMQEEHKIFMQEYEKYGNNCMQIARVLNTQTPAQIKKACWMFFQTKFEKEFCSSETILNEMISRVPLSQYNGTGFDHTCR